MYRRNKHEKEFRAKNIKERERERERECESESERESGTRERGLLS